MLYNVRCHADEYEESDDDMYLSSGTLMLASSSWVSWGRPPGSISLHLSRVMSFWASCWCRALICNLRAWFSTSRRSASWRLRSRELCAAARLRLIRSMRRCSFSSAVFARFRGGRLVLGSGSAWPHDFLFFAGLAADDCGRWRELGVAIAVVAAVDGVIVKSGVFMLSGSGVVAARSDGGDNTGPSAMMYEEA